MNTSDYSRMVVIPEGDYKSLIAQRQTQNDNNKIYMSDIHQMEKSSLPADQYLKQYYTLNKAQHNIDKVDEIPQVSEVVMPQSTWIENAISAMSKPVRHRAELLYSFLKSKSPIIEWNEKGEISGQDVPIIVNSNIVDLIQYMVSTITRKRMNNPNGLDPFIHLLRILNIPQSYLGQVGITAMNQQKYIKTTPTESSNTWTELYAKATPSKHISKWTKLN
jgi:hypothetical protein